MNKGDEVELIGHGKKMKTTITGIEMFKKELVCGCGQIHDHLINFRLKRKLVIILGLFAVVSSVKILQKEWLACS